MSPAGTEFYGLRKMEAQRPKRGGKWWGGDKKEMSQSNGTLPCFWKSQQAAVSVVVRVAVVAATVFCASQQGIVRLLGLANMEARVSKDHQVCLHMRLVGSGELCDLCWGEGWQ